jgi:hypothetical protein
MQSLFDPDAGSEHFEGTFLVQKQPADPNGGRLAPLAAGWKDVLSYRRIGMSNSAAQQGQPDAGVANASNHFFTADHE